MKLSGDKGAKQIIFDHRDEVAIVPFPEGSIDINTPDDYKRLIESDNPPTFP
jgi:molybdenum cofactor cytidylyltransferase